MILERGDMWSIAGVTDWFLITTNPVINKQGLAVMGRGIAKEAAGRFPTLRRDFADKIASRKVRGNLCGVYTIGGYAVQTEWRSYTLRIGCFMVKDHWMEKAKLSLIKD